MILEKREEGRERGKESERNSDVREKYLVHALTGTKMQPRHVP